MKLYVFLCLIMDTALVFFLLMLFFLLAELLFPVMIPISLAGGCFSSGMLHILEVDWFWLVIVFMISSVLTYQIGKLLSKHSETDDPLP
jgi:membrane protein implicated in regulation of membrane protease activity